MLADLLTPVLFSNENRPHLCSPRKQFGNLTWLHVSIQTSSHWQPWSCPLPPPPSPAPSRFIKRFCQSSGTFRASLADLWVCGQSTRELQLQLGDPDGSARVLPLHSVAFQNSQPQSSVRGCLYFQKNVTNQDFHSHIQPRMLFCAHTQKGRVLNSHKFSRQK